MERKKTTAKRKGRPITVISEHEALAGAASTAGLSLQNFAQSADSNLENTASSLREILANCGHPLEVIIRKLLIPKLYAKETKVFVIGGKIETRVTDDHNIQLKTAIELLKMCGSVRCTCTTRSLFRQLVDVA